MDKRMTMPRSAPVFPQSAPLTSLPFDEIRTWMFDKALPFWAKNGVGGPTAFYETCHMDGGADLERIIRVRVIARQVYVFSHAHILGWDGPALELARAGIDALIQRVWLGEGKGWARLMSPNGDVHDATPDLYDYAFVLFALGWWMQASGDRTLEPYANATLDLIEQAMPHPSGRGHAHKLPYATPSQQNPHMHLTEASLVLDRATGDGRWLSKAAEITSLFRDHFCDSSDWSLTEFFDEDWRPAPGLFGQIVEPGHQMEWAWILHQYMQRSGQDFSAEITGLVHAAERRGVSPKSGLVYGSVLRDGRVNEPHHRIWPQTERIKGNLALLELTGEDRSQPIAAAANALLHRYFAPAPAGAWIDMLSEQGEAQSKNIPASTFYHVFLAFAELLRLQPALTAPRA